MAAREPSADPPRFDEVLAKLQAVVEQLEAADIPLEQSLRAFQEGVELSRTGQRILDEAEAKVEVLLRDGDTQPLDDDA